MNTNSDYENFRIAALQIEVQCVFLTNLARRVSLMPAEAPENWEAQRDLFYMKVLQTAADIEAFTEI